MRVPLSWLREFVDVPDTESARDVADILLRAGLEVEAVQSVGSDIAGPVVVGQVRDVEEFTASNGKTIRYCQVDVGAGQPRGIVCGATNFEVGDRVVVSLPGAMLPGGFEISARKTYGHLSDGMICSVRELGIGDDHTGILVVDPDAPVGAPAVPALGLRDDVLDIAVTPDRGYCLSIRGVARETAIAYRAAFRDPAAVGNRAGGETGLRPVVLADPSACDRFVLRGIEGFDPKAASPLRIRLRLMLAGMRPVSLAVDVTNYVMLELGQPLHAFDAGKLVGGIVVRRAAAGERLETLDHIVRTLDPEDVLITDDSGPISLAGTMGGLATEIDDASKDLLLEAAHFPPVGVARMSRRHKLSSEASRRFERGVDPALPPQASARAATLLVEHGGGRLVGVSEVDLSAPPVAITIAADHPDRVAGMSYGRDVVVQRLRDVGCSVSDADGDQLRVVPPSWRSDLTDPNDLAEEVIRLEGYDAVPAELPRAPVGGGLTESQRLRRRVGRALADAGYVEVLAYPFVAAGVFDDLGFAGDDPRRRALRLANPLSDEAPLLRTTLLPGVLEALRRNVARGVASGVALFETGLVYLPGAEQVTVPPRLGVGRRPTDDELAAVLAALPDQPLHLAVALAGERTPRGWWGPGRDTCWADAVQAIRDVARTLGLHLHVEAAEQPPWHPGRCASIAVDGAVVGHAGELHPRVCAALDLPPRTCAAEVNLAELVDRAGGPVQSTPVSSFPVATQDVALVVAAGVPAAVVAAALRAGAGALLESLRLFDVYTGDQVGEGRRSLAYALRFRAPDRTLTTEEVTAARDAAVAEAGRRVGAVLRG